MISKYRLYKWIKESWNNLKKELETSRQVEMFRLENEMREGGYRMCEIKRATECVQYECTCGKHREVWNVIKVSGKEEKENKKIGARSGTKMEKKKWGEWSILYIIRNKISVEYTIQYYICSMKYHLSIFYHSRHIFN